MGYSSRFNGFNSKFCSILQCTYIFSSTSKKPDGNKLNVYDVAGASEIVNLSHNVVFISKIEEAEKEKMKAKGIECDSIMVMKKNRFDGDVERPILLKYDYNSKRLYSNDNEREKTYSIYKNDEDEDYINFADFCDNWSK